MESNVNITNNEAKTFKDVEYEIKGLVATNKLLRECQKKSDKQNKRLCKIIVLLIILMFLEGIGGFGIFAWYESQFEFAEGETITEEYSTKGNNANINKVDGNNNSINNVSGNN